MKHTKQFEYKQWNSQNSLEPIKALNALGKQGWQVKHVRDFQKTLEVRGECSNKRQVYSHSMYLLEREIKL